MPTTPRPSVRRFLEPAALSTRDRLKPRRPASLARVGGSMPTPLTSSSCSTVTRVACPRAPRLEEKTYVFIRRLAAAAMSSQPRLPALALGPGPDRHHRLSDRLLALDACRRLRGTRKIPGWHVQFGVSNSGAEIFAAIASVTFRSGSPAPALRRRSSAESTSSRLYQRCRRQDEALSSAMAPAQHARDLKGKRLAAAPVSTYHYMLLSTLKEEASSRANHRPGDPPARNRRPAGARRYRCRLCLGTSPGTLLQSGKCC